MVTEQGTSAFQFNVTASTLTANFAAGSQLITVKDSLGDVASAAFTITAQATVTLGSATVNSGVPYAPAGATGVAAWLSVSGFKASSVLTITSSPGVPAAWTTFVYNTYPVVTTDASGSVVIPAPSGTGTAPPSGVYSMTISDGTNTVTVLLTITSSGNFFVISPIAGAQGTTVMLTGFLTTPATTTAINFDGAAVAGATQCAANTWPTPPSTVGVFTVPPSGAGPHTITATGISGASATFTNTGAPAINIVTPASAAVGTTVTLVGSGFANNLVQSLPSFTIDSITVPTTGVAFANGAVVVTFAVPVFLPGTHIISATDGYFNTATASLTTTVSSITVSPTKGVIAGTGMFGTMLTLTGSNFPMNQPITTTMTGVGSVPGYFGGVGLTSTNTNGGILLDWLAIPDTQTVAGSHTITVTAGTASATATFTVSSTVSLTATAVKPGGTTSITGAGFAASSALSLLINSVATSWYNTAVTPATVLTTAPSTNTVGSLPTGIGTVIASTANPGSYNVTVVDAAGNAASATLTVLGAPAITLAAAQGISGVGTVGITGVGFTPGSRVASAQLLQGSTVVTALTVSTPITVNSTGGISASANINFTVPTVPAGVYNVSLTLTLPTESAIATFTILGAPTVTTSVTSAKVGANVTATVVGIQTVSVATLGITNLLGQGANTFGSTTVSATGANAYNLTTWFIVPSIPGGAYTMLFGDGVRSAFATFTVVPSISLSPATGILKGTIVYVTGAGFATAGTPISVTVNGVLTTIPTGTGTTGTGGTVSTNFVVPLTAVANNTVVVTDISGNNATSYFAITPPTITLTPTTGPAGSTVQIIGNAFTPYSAIVVEVGANIVNTIPSTASPNPAGQFIAYVTIPAALSGNQTITVIDSSNNVATAIFAIGGTSTGIIVDQTALSTTAQTLNSAGQPATSFARGSTVKISFVLDSTVGGGNVLWRVTLQQGTAVYNIATTSASISSTPTTLSFSQLIPTGIAAGTWTASVQIFGSDGVTPLGVATLVFNVT
jgi:hypothetical protein